MSEGDHSDTDSNEISVSKPLPRYENGVEILQTFMLNRGTLFYCSAGGVIGFTGDAIVNAANEGCLGGAGVDGAINDRGGRELERARYNLPVLEPGVRCRTGEAVYTIAGKLSCKFVIHAVGPSFSMRASSHDTEDEYKLKMAYINSLKLAETLIIPGTNGEIDRPLESIAFSLLSAGVFRGRKSIAEVLEIGIRAIIEYFDEFRDKKSNLKQVYMCAFTSTEKRDLVEAAVKILKPVEAAGDEIV